MQAVPQVADLVGVCWQTSRPLPCRQHYSLSSNCNCGLQHASICSTGAVMRRDSSGSLRSHPPVLQSGQQPVSLLPTARTQTPQTAQQSRRFRQPDQQQKDTWMQQPVQQQQQRSQHEEQRQKQQQLWLQDAKVPLHPSQVAVQQVRSLTSDSQSPPQLEGLRALAAKAARIIRRQALFAAAPSALAGVSGTAHSSYPAAAAAGAAAATGNDSSTAVDGSTDTASNVVLPAANIDQALQEQGPVAMLLVVALQQQQQQQQQQQLRQHQSLQWRHPQQQQRQRQRMQQQRQQLQQEQHPWFSSKDAAMLWAWFYRQVLVKGVKLGSADKPPVTATTGTNSSTTAATISGGVLRASHADTAEPIIEPTLLPKQQRLQQPEAAANAIDTVTAAALLHATAAMGWHKYNIGALTGNNKAVNQLIRCANELLCFGLLAASTSATSSSSSSSLNGAALACPPVAVVSLVTAALKLNVQFRSPEKLALQEQVLAAALSSYSPSSSRRLGYPLVMKLLYSCVSSGFQLSEKVLQLMCARVQDHVKERSELLLPLLLRLSKLTQQKHTLPTVGYQLLQQFVAKLFALLPQQWATKCLQQQVRQRLYGLTDAQWEKWRKQRRQLRRQRWQQQEKQGAKQQPSQQQQQEATGNGRPDTLIISSPIQQDAPAGPQLCCNAEEFAEVCAAVSLLPHQLPPGFVSTILLLPGVALLSQASAQLRQGTLGRLSSSTSNSSSRRSKTSPAAAATVGPADSTCFTPSQVSQWLYFLARTAGPTLTYSARKQLAVNLLDYLGEMLKFGIVWGPSRFLPLLLAAAEFNLPSIVGPEWRAAVHDTLLRELEQYRPAEVITVLQCMAQAQGLTDHELIEQHYLPAASQPFWTPTETAVAAIFAEAVGSSGSSGTTLRQRGHQQQHEQGWRQQRGWLQRKQQRPVKPLALPRMVDLLKVLAELKHKPQDPAWWQNFQAVLLQKCAAQQQRRQRQQQQGQQKQQQEQQVTMQQSQHLQQEQQQQQQRPCQVQQIPELTAQQVVQVMWAMGRLNLTAKPRVFAWMVQQLELQPQSVKTLSSSALVDLFIGLGKLVPKNPMVVQRSQYLSFCEALKDKQFTANEIANIIRCMGSIADGTSEGALSGAMVAGLLHRTANKGGFVTDCSTDATLDDSLDAAFQQSPKALDYEDPLGTADSDEVLQKALLDQVLAANLPLLVTADSIHQQLGHVTDQLEQLEEFQQQEEQQQQQSPTPTTGLQQQQQQQEALVPPKAIVMTLLDAVMPHLEALKGRGLSMLMWGTRKMGYKPSHRWLARYQEVAIAAMPALADIEVAIIFSCLVHTGCPVTVELLQRLLSRWPKDDYSPGILADLSAALAIVEQQQQQVAEAAWGLQLAQPADAAAVAANEYNGADGVGKTGVSGPVPLQNAGEDEYFGNGFTRLDLDSFIDRARSEIGAFSELLQDGSDDETDNTSSNHPPLDAQGAATAGSIAAYEALPMQQQVQAVAGEQPEQNEGAVRQIDAEAGKRIAEKIEHLLARL